MNLYHNVKAQWLAYAVFFLLLASLPIFVSDSFLLNQFATYGVFGMLALSISLCWGFGGILNLGQGIPFGLGAYGMAMTMQMQTQDASNPIPPFMLNNSLDHLPLLWEPFRHTALGIVLSLVVPTVFCALFGGLMFRARVSGPFFAIMTLAMLSAWFTLILDIQPYTNGANGITPPSPLKLGDYAVDPYSPVAYWSVLALLLVATVGAKLMTLSRFRARRAGGARGCGTGTLSRLQRRRLRDHGVYNRWIYRRGCGMLLGRSDAIRLARAVRHDIQPVDGDLGWNWRSTVVDRGHRRRLSDPGRAKLPRRYIPQHLAAGARRVLHSGGPLPAEGTGRSGRKHSRPLVGVFEEQRKRCCRASPLSATRRMAMLYLPYPWR